MAHHPTVNVLISSLVDYRASCTTLVEKIRELDNQNRELKHEVVLLKSNLRQQEELRQLKEQQSAVLQNQQELLELARARQDCSKGQNSRKRRITYDQPIVVLERLDGQLPKGGVRSVKIVRIN